MAATFLGLVYRLGLTNASLSISPVVNPAPASLMADRQDTGGLTRVMFLVSTLNPETDRFSHLLGLSQ